MFLTFMTEDVFVHIAADQIAKIEEVGDKLTITTTDGHTTEYEYVCATRWSETPPLSYWESAREARV